MAWLFFAFSGPVLWAISTHFDKYLVERYFKHNDVAVLLLFTAPIGLLTLPFIAYYERKVFEPSAASIALIVLSGVRGILIVAGTLIVSLRFGHQAHRFKLRLVLLMLCCGLAAAVSSLIFKLFAIEVAFWTTTFWMFVGEAIFGVGLLCVGSYRRQLVDLFRSNAAALLTVNGSNELINLGGGLGNRYALMFAPLSIVQAISSTTTLFVFVFGVLLSVLFPRFGRETLSRRDLLQKGAAAVLVALGVALVTS
jgi:drug/metabolite transporter (DMT)-like permease